VGIAKPSNRILIEGDHNVVKQFPLFGKGEPLYLWAERGLVHWESAKTNGYGSMPWQEAAFRVISLSEMATNSSEEGYYADEAYRLKKFVCEMENVIRQAKEQGGPLDEGAAAHHAARRAKSVVVPRTVNVDPFPEIF
jgi:hypothetical protein